jgi:hypothetical protein
MAERRPLLEAAGIDTTRRAEELPPETWVRLWEAAR